MQSQKQLNPISARIQRNLYRGDEGSAGAPIVEAPRDKGIAGDTSQKWRSDRLLNFDRVADVKTA